MVKVGVASRARIVRRRVRISKVQSVAAILFAACAVYGVTAVGSAHAAPQDDGLSDLRNFVQSVGSQPTAPTSPDASVAALGEFMRGVKARPAGVQVAEADNLFDALRQWSGQQNGSAAQAQSKPAAVSKARASKAAVDAILVDNKVCLTCHAAQAATFSKTLMGRIGKTKPGMFDCQNCHGPGSEHVKLGGGRGVGGIMGFGPTDPRTAEEKSAICLGCHEKGDRTLWQGSTHQTRNVACTDCHTIMKEVSRKYQLKTKSQPDTCFQCHKDIRAKFERSAHMPVTEGKMACSDCHNPHGSYSEKLLKQATVNDTCFQCHAEKRGPFLWEHPPVAENCLNCHDPHGSINDNLLRVARPRLCQRCHNAANNHPANPRNPTSVFAVNNGCNNCHTQIHGSNSPGGQFLHR